MFPLFLPSFNLLNTWPKIVNPFKKIIFRLLSVFFYSLFPVLQFQCLTYYPWDGLLGHKFDKRLESFTPCYSVFTVSSTGEFYRKPSLRTIKSAKQENSSLFMNSILLNRKTRVENQTKTRVREDSSLCPETSTKTAVQEFHLLCPVFQP